VRANAAAAPAILKRGTSSMQTVKLNTPAPIVMIMASLEAFYPLGEYDLRQ